MSNIIIPSNGDRSVSFEDISKKRLAQIVNQQARAIAQLNRLIELLQAITLEPDALHLEEGSKRFWIDAAALERIPQGSELKSNRVGDKVYLWTDTPAVTEVQPNRIVLPPPRLN